MSKQRKVLAGRRSLYVNLGAGNSGREGWVNIDTDPNLKGINCVWDCRKGLPMEPASVKGFFSEHFLEHLDYGSEVPALLRDVFSALQSGGIARIVVPDAEKYIVAYVSDGWTEMTRVRPLVGANVDLWTGYQCNTKMELLNIVFRQGVEHMYAWDFETMRLALERAGFTEIHRREFGIGNDPVLLIDRPDRASESVYVEAIKA